MYGKFRTLLFKQIIMKTIGFIHIDSMIDIITNSSSELFVIENKLAKPLLVELVNTALTGTNHKITEFSIDDRFVKEKAEYETYVDEILENFPSEDREELRKRYFTDAKYYAISFDRDHMEDNVRTILYNLGFELIDSDY